MISVPHSYSFDGHILKQILPRMSQTPTLREVPPLLAAPGESSCFACSSRVPEWPGLLCPPTLVRSAYLASKPESREGWHPKAKGQTGEGPTADVYFVGHHSYSWAQREVL